jgi:hypothetical protein
MEGLRSLMESIDGPRVVAAETSVEDGADAIRDLEPSLVILDKSFGTSTVADWVRLLSDRGMVEHERPGEDGRGRLYRLRPEPFAELQDWRP